MAETGEQDEPRDFAAEYALGVLDASERLEVQRRIASDPAFAAEVVAWERRLAPLASAYDEQPAPDRVREAVEARLFGEPGSVATPFGIRFWRSLAFAALAALVVSLSAHALRLNGTDAGVILVVSLEPADEVAGRFRFLAVLQPDYDEVRTAPLEVEAASGRDFELWLVRNGGPPVSLGLLPSSGSANIELPAGLADQIDEGDTLAVSLEPEGGSPTGQPTGPIIAAGSARRL